MLVDTNKRPVKTEIVVIQLEMQYDLRRSRRKSMELEYANKFLTQNVTNCRELARIAFMIFFMIHGFLL